MKILQEPYPQCASFIPCTFLLGWGMGSSCGRYGCHFLSIVLSNRCLQCTSFLVLVFHIFLDIVPHWRAFRTWCVLGPLQLDAICQGLFIDFFFFRLLFISCLQKPLGGGGAPHDIHHYWPNKNFGFVLTCWDHLFGTFSPVVEPPKKPQYYTKWWEWSRNDAANKDANAASGFE